MDGQKGIKLQATGVKEKRTDRVRELVDYRDAPQMIIHNISFII